MHETSRRRKGRPNARRRMTISASLSSILRDGENPCSKEFESALWNERSSAASSFRSSPGSPSTKNEGALPDCGLSIGKVENSCFTSFHCRFSAALDAPPVKSGATEGVGSERREEDPARLGSWSVEVS